ncbi:MAG: transglutaminase family protein [Proteobacteria bacterium]|nr:transglutaminase family protein [Pseudomonadota bacterium]
MIYDVRQTTTYHYASEVAYAHHLLRLTPIDRPGQRVHAAALDIAPVPVERREGKDFFGNRATWIAFDHAHDSLTVRAVARVAVSIPDVPLAEVTPTWEQVRDKTFGDTDLGASSPAHHVFPSRQVPLDPEIRAYAAASFPDGRPVLDGAVELMRRIKSDFIYEIGATTVSTMPARAFALRRGVCQDFAHIMISGLRGLGLPAAYVSGYLRTAQPSDVVRLEGSDAMHAWVLVWCGQAVGWLGLDPTNGISVGNDHIVLAIGRDYADVAPIGGIVVAAGGQRLEVSVTVQPINEAKLGSPA